MNQNYMPVGTPRGGAPMPTPLYPNKLVEYTGEGEFHHNFHGVLVDFVPQVQYDGRKVMRINRTDVFHSLVSIPSGNFVVAEDLEAREKVVEMTLAVVENADMIMDALKNTEAFQNAVAEIVSRKTKRGKGEEA